MRAAVDRLRYGRAVLTRLRGLTAVFLAGLAALASTPAAGATTPAPPSQPALRPSTAIIASMVPGHRFGNASDAGAVAVTTDRIVLHPGAPRMVSAMHAANPALLVGAYRSITGARGAAELVPSCVARDDAGNRLVFVGDATTVLEDPRCPEWQRAVVERCAHDVLVDGYDRCYWDVMGQNDFGVIYVDEITHRPASPAGVPIDDWMRAKRDILVAALAATGTKAWTNCLQRGEGYGQIWQVEDGCYDPEVTELAQMESFNSPNTTGPPNSFTASCAALQGVTVDVIAGEKMSAYSTVPELRGEAEALICGGPRTYLAEHIAGVDPAVWPDDSAHLMAGLGAQRTGLLRTSHGLLLRGFACGGAVLNDSTVRQPFRLPVGGTYHTLNGYTFAGGTEVGFGGWLGNAFIKDGCTP